MMTNTTERPGPTLRPWQELRRSHEDSKIAGVGGGLARWLGLDPLLVRVVLVALVLVGGIGVLAYAVLWLAVPREDEAEAIGARLLSGRGDEAVVWPVLLLILGLSLAGGTWLFGTGNGLGLALVAVVVTFVLLNRGRHPAAPAAPGHPSDAPPAETPAAGTAAGTAGSGGTASFAQGGVGSWPSPPSDTGDRTPFWVPPTVPVARVAPVAPPRPREPRVRLPRITYSLAAVAAGLAVAFGALTGTSVPGRVVLSLALGVVAGGLIVSAAQGFRGRRTGRRFGLLTVGTLLTLAVVASWQPDGHARTASFTPRSDAALTAGYQQGAGDLRLDLRQLPPGTHDVRAELGAGTLVVVVPTDAAVSLSANAGVGQISVVDGDRRSSTKGVGASRDLDLAGSGGTSNSFDLDLQVGLGQVEVRRG